MKKNFVLAIAMMAIGFAQAQTTPTTTPATVTAPPVVPKDIAKTLEFTNDAFDFGKIPTGKAIEYELTIKNISKEAVILKNVSVGCGCTTPKYEKDKSFGPGETIKVTLGFNGNANGPFSKSATLYFNDDMTKPVTFRGDAYQPPTTPANTGTQVMKP
ncbi:MAG: DUF1573 domain-containing protein [Flavobacterium sp.]|nr:DUF1573 domain-containing protein [Flavobacterium sp.]